MSTSSRLLVSPRSVSTTLLSSDFARWLALAACADTWCTCEAMPGASALDRVDRSACTAFDNTMFAVETQSCYYDIVL